MRKVPNEAIEAFEKLIKEYQAVTKEDIEFIIDNEDKFPTTNPILYYITGLASNCSLCKAAGNDCTKCMYHTLSVKDEEMMCVSSNSANLKHFKGIKNSRTVGTLLPALVDKVKYMKALLAEYTKKESYGLLTYF